MEKILMNQEYLFNSILWIISEFGSTTTTHTVCKEWYKRYNHRLTNHEKNNTMPSSNEKVWRNNVRQAIRKLRAQNYLVTPRRGVYSINMRPGFWEEMYELAISQTGNRFLSRK